MTLSSNVLKRLFICNTNLFMSMQTFTVRKDLRERKFAINLVVAIILDLGKPSP